MVGGVQQLETGNVQLVLNVCHGPVEAAPGARFVGALGAQGALMQAQFKNHRLAAWLADDGCTPDSGCIGHALRHGCVDSVGSGHGFFAVKSWHYCAIL